MTRRPPPDPLLDRLLAEQDMTRAQFEVIIAWQAIRAERNRLLMPVAEWLTRHLTRQREDHRDGVG